MFSNPIKLIEDLLAQGEVKKALEQLQQWTEEHAPNERSRCVMLLSRLNVLEQDNNMNLLSHADYEVSSARILNAAIQLLDGCRKATSDSSSLPALHEYHRYTCDRVDQNDRFIELFEKAQIQKAQFYYIYGIEQQSHEGMFKRISYDLEGRLLDYLNPNLPAACKVLMNELTFDPSRNIDIYKKNIIKSLLASLQIPVNEHEPLLDKNLSYVLDKSPLLKELCAQDYVCTFIHISHWDWDSTITPGAARWFIQEFCKDALSPEAPKFLFFLGIEYEEDDQALKEEVHQIVNSSDIIQALPELMMVYMGDIIRWVNKYKMLAETTTEQRQLVQQHFGNEKEFYMENVETTLLKIIDAYNKRYI